MRCERARGRPHRRPGAAAFAVVLVLAASPAAAQDADKGREKAAAACASCHGADGNSTSATFPVLAGQTARYLYLQLRDFKEGRRDPGPMQAVLAPLTKDDLFDLAAWFSSRTPRGTGFQPDPAKARRGEAKAAETLCSMCHLGGLKGQNEIPRLAGQHHDYVVKQLQDFRAGRRTNDAGNMSSVSKTLSDQDIDDLAHYIAGLD